MDAILQRIRDRTLRDRVRNRQERQRIEDELANTLGARLKRAYDEGIAEVDVDDFSRHQRLLRPKRQVPDNRADRLRVLFESPASSITTDSP